MINWDRIHKLGTTQKKPAPAPAAAPVVASPAATGPLVKRDPRDFMRGLGRQATAAVQAKTGIAPDSRLPGHVKYAEAQRAADMAKGEEFAAKHFGAGNPEIAAVLEARKQAALGLNPTEVNMMRERGTAGINQTMAQGMRQLRGLQATNGVRGGAAIGQALPMMTQANMARQGLESDIALADMARRQDALNALESTVTGERAGTVGSIFGFAGMGSTDRANALQHLFGKDFLKMSQNQLAAAGDPLGGDDRPWYQKQWGKMEDMWGGLGAQLGTLRAPRFGSPALANPSFGGPSTPIFGGGSTSSGRYF